MSEESLFLLFPNSNGWVGLVPRFGGARPRVRRGGWDTAPASVWVGRVPRLGRAARLLMTRPRVGALMGNLGWAEGARPWGRILAQPL